ncbi:hypothetical protein F751_3541 [Auxenochlorella protothecoides]|uniref:Uncharacterized protein n=1 Tax=Auxenochlorella protothecoides TaxID=3075 RepID=A0A087SSK7_AUXPR|nr:hypothetical protein F751_3541 [Auxenochlorella protothecoides]KFM28711.1 hypothetical protein F751_3541 [Auxenochlorella protothecoides]
MSILDGGWGSGTADLGIPPVPHPPITHASPPLLLHEACTFGTAAYQPILHVDPQLEPLGHEEASNRVHQGFQSPLEGGKLIGAPGQGYSL